MSEDQVVRNDDASRYELHVDGSMGKIDYRLTGDKLALVHTEVPDELGGRGIGGKLARAALDDAAERGLTVVPYCPFVQAYLKRHGDIAERQPIEWPN